MTLWVDTKKYQKWSSSHGSGNCKLYGITIFQAFPKTTSEILSSWVIRLTTKTIIVPFLLKCHGKCVPKLSTAFPRQSGKVRARNSPAGHFLYFNSFYLRENFLNGIFGPCKFNWISILQKGLASNLYRNLQCSICRRDAIYVTPLLH